MANVPAQDNLYPYITFASGPNKLYCAEVALTDAQIKAWPTTSIDVISAAPAGYRNKFLFGTVYINNSFGLYTNVNTTYASLVFQWPTGEWASGPVINDNSFVKGGGVNIQRLYNNLSVNDRVVMNFPQIHTALMDACIPGTSIWSAIAGEVFSPYSADKIQAVFDNNGSGNLTGGNASNSGKITVVYMVEKI